MTEKVEVGTRVIVPAYSVQNDIDGEVLEAETGDRVGEVRKIMDDGNLVTPGRVRRWCFVVLDDPLGNNDVRQCWDSELIVIEKGAEFYEPAPGG